MAHTRRSLWAATSCAARLSRRLFTVESIRQPCIREAASYTPELPVCQHSERPRRQTAAEFIVVEFVAGRSITLTTGAWNDAPLAPTAIRNHRSRRILVSVCPVPAESRCKMVMQAGLVEHFTPCKHVVPAGGINRKYHHKIRQKHRKNRYKNSAEAAGAANADARGLEFRVLGSNPRDFA